MKCRSVACIWSDSPPVHRVTSAAVLSHPPTLYTGGSDGSIIWWNLYPVTDSHQEIKPIAMLCGHAASISGLAICYPTGVLGHEKDNDSSNVAPNSISVNYGALISACTDGVLCVWSRGSGHCRRRRKLPPWVGNPCVLQPLQDNQRYVCIACSSIDSVHPNDHQPLNSTEKVEALVDGESQQRRPCKCTVVIVDTYTLTIVQTIFHGNLSISPMKFMAINSFVGDMEKQHVLLVDSFGKVQCVPILKDSNRNSESSTSQQKSFSHSEQVDWGDESSEGEQVVAFATCGQVLAFVHATRCVFRLVDGGTIIGEIDFTDDQLCFEGSASRSYVISGMFLDSHRAGMIPSNGENGKVVIENFAVWNNIGYAVVYRLSYLSNIFKFEPLFAIPAVLHSPDVGISIRFIQLNSCLVRIESVCCLIEDSFLGKPCITLWSLSQQYDNKDKLSQDCKVVGKGNLFDHWKENASTKRTEDLRQSFGTQSRRKDELPFQSSCVSCPEDVDSIHANNGEQQICCKERLVSSSMIISENYYAPYAIVYGFYSGEIEVVRFNVFFEGLDLHNGSPRHELGSRVTIRYLSGHTGAVLCLAAHRILNTGKGWNHHVLVSGSMDCTVRIWDIDSSTQIRVMHQHVAPVRQIIFPPIGTDHPWSDCFLSVGEDSCVALTSLETLQVERMFPGHPCYPAKVLWDSKRGYIACLCLNNSGASDSLDILYVWDIKTGARERILRGTAAFSMFDHFGAGISINSISGSLMNANTSTSSLILPIIEDTDSSQTQHMSLGKGISSSSICTITTNLIEPCNYQKDASKGSAAKQFSPTPLVLERYKHPVKSSCPFPGIATLSFDLSSLMSLSEKHEFIKHASDSQTDICAKVRGAEAPKDVSNERRNTYMKDQGVKVLNPNLMAMDDNSNFTGIFKDILDDDDWVQSLEGCLLRFSLSFLHLWNVDVELDKLLISEMKLKRPENFILAAGLLGDRGSLTLTFPGSAAALELWKSSSEFCAMRSLTIVSLAQHILTLSHSCSVACSALAAFYTRNFAEKVRDIKPPLLQLLVSFWQDECEHVRMAARSIFHCAASRAIPSQLCGEKVNNHEKVMGSSNGMVRDEHDSPRLQEMPGYISGRKLETEVRHQGEEAEMLDWLESFEMQDWISCVGGTSQDAMTSYIIVAAALAIWYPGLVKPSLAMLTVHPLMKLVMAMNEKYSCTAMEILAEGMENTWIACIGPEIPGLIADVFFQIECTSGTSAKLSAQKPAMPVIIRENLVEILLPSLAMADIAGFLNVIERQIWSTASDSPVHVVALMTLMRVTRGSPKNLALYLDKAVTFVLQMLDPSNSVMRKTCLPSSLIALKEIVRVFPMVSLNEASTRLAVGDAIREINSASIRVYEMQSMMKIKVLDASGPAGLPNLFGGPAEIGAATAISALSFSPEGEGLVAFSENGLVIRWWSLGSVWWEKISRNLVPVQCTKLIFVPPWEGFSPNSTRSSIMASVMGNHRQADLQENTKGLSEIERLKLLLHNLDLSYRLQWMGQRQVQLTRHGHELGSFLL